MHDFGNYILDIAMTIATVWIVKRFWESFFEKSKKSIWSTIMWIIFCVFQMFFQYNSGDVNIGITIKNVILILGIAICGYNCRGKQKYFLVVIFCAVWSLLEFFVFFMLSNLQMQQENLNLLGIVISKIFMIICVYVMSVCWSKRRGEFIPNNFYLYLLIVPVGSIYIAISEFYSKSDKISAILIISILLIFNVVIFELYIKMNELFMYEKEKTVYAQQLEIIAGNTVEQKKMMEEFHEEKHNLINELIVLKEGIERDDKTSVIDHLNKIINNCHNVEIISNSGNSTVDAIINFKYAVASEYGIDFGLKIFIPDKLPIEQCDIGVVLGNAIDNAIEAVKICKRKQKIIEISMGVKKEAWIMVIKNPYEHEIKKDRDERIISTKHEKHRHGYGLKSIMRIAEEYQGEVIIDTENGIFSLTVILNFGEF